jgi:DNA-binding transcriptional LysR family regulator
MISLIAMLEEGIGITTLPSLAFPQGNEQLVFLPLSEPKVERQIGILCRKGRSLSPAAAELMNFLRANMQLNGESEKAV